MKRREALKQSGWLAGGAIALPTLASVLQSCSTQDPLDWQPVFLDESEARFISTFVDTILPATDTPGGLDVKVDVFLDRVFAEGFPSDSQENVRSSIAEMNQECIDAYGTKLPELSEEDRKAQFQKWEENTATFNSGVWGTSVGEQKPVGFYRQLKSSALWGYFTSEEIGKNVLRYDPIPGAYDACIPLDGKLWSS